MEIITIIKFVYRYWFTQSLELLYKMQAVRNTAADDLTKSIIVKNTSSCSNGVKSRRVDSKKLCFGESSVHFIKMNYQGSGEIHLQM